MRSGAAAAEGRLRGREQRLVFGRRELEALGDLLDDAELVGVDRSVEAGDLAEQVDEVDGAQRGQAEEEYPGARSSDWKWSTTSLLSR